MAMTNLQIINLDGLRKEIATYFNLEELKYLCSSLEIDYEELSEKNKSEKILDLIAYCRRHNRLLDLKNLLKENRSFVLWVNYFE